MKGFYLFILLLLFPLFVAGQANNIQVINKWCLNPDTALLFPTGNNEIMIISKDINPKELVVKSLDHALKIAAPDYHGDTMVLLAMPYPKYGKHLRLSIADKKSRKELKTINFSCGEPPVPVARLGSIAKNEAPKKDVVAQTAMRVAFANSLYNYPYRIKEYTFKTRIAGKDIQIPVKGYMIPAEVANVISNAPVGAFLEFTNIQAACQQCNPRKLPDVKVWVR